MKKAMIIIMLLGMMNARAEIPHLFQGGGLISAEEFNQNFSDLDQRLVAIESEPATGSISLQLRQCEGDLTGTDVYILGTSINGRTDSNGVITLTAVPEGTYSLQVKKASVNIDGVLENIAVVSGEATSLGIVDDFCSCSDDDNTTADYLRDGVCVHLSCSDPTASAIPNSVSSSLACRHTDCDNPQILAFGVCRTSEELNILDAICSDGISTTADTFNRTTLECQSICPSNVEIPANGIDDDCDGQIDEGV